MVKMGGGEDGQILMTIIRKFFMFGKMEDFFFILLKLTIHVSSMVHALFQINISYTKNATIKEMVQHLKNTVTIFGVYS